VVDEMEKQILDLLVNMEDRLESIDKRQQKMEDRLGSIGDKQQKMDEKLDSVYETVKRIESSQTEDVISLLKL
jgi:archaellum component FlaC